VNVRGVRRKVKKRQRDARRRRIRMGGKGIVLGGGRREEGDKKRVQGRGAKGADKEGGEERIETGSLQDTWKWNSVSNVTGV
jgi:hypothetical protein